MRPEPGAPGNLQPPVAGELFDLRRGRSPILFSVPHAGTACPDWLAGRMTESGRALPDTDWEVDRLVDFAPTRGHGLLVARATRYLVDLNRPPDDRNLYPGQPTSGICPLHQFDGGPIYRDGLEPDAAEVQKRIRWWWQPVHLALAEEIARLVAEHGYAIVFDCHSIASRVPRLFEGTLPHLNLGTNHGASCAATLERAVQGRLAAGELEWVLNGRFVGGAITRTYGRPAENVHALQIEMGWDAYRTGGAWDDAKASTLRRALLSMTEALESWSPDH